MTFIERLNRVLLGPYLTFLKSACSTSVYIGKYNVVNSVQIRVRPQHSTHQHVKIVTIVQVNMIFIDIANKRW